MLSISCITIKVSYLGAGSVHLGMGGILSLSICMVDEELCSLESVKYWCWEEW